MKNFTLLLLICIFFQGCYSYKTIDHKSYEFKTNEKYKVTLKEGEKLKGIIINSTKNKITITSKKEKNPITLQVSSIEKIGKQKFSLLKTGVTTYLGVLAALGGAILIILSIL